MASAAPTDLPTEDAKHISAMLSELEELVGSQGTCAALSNSTLESINSLANDESTWGLARSANPNSGILITYTGSMDDLAHLVQSIWAAGGPTPETLQSFKVRIESLMRIRSSLLDITPAPTAAPFKADKLPKKFEGTPQPDGQPDEFPLKLAEGDYVVGWSVSNSGAEDCGITFSLHEDGGLADYLGISAMTSGSGLGGDSKGISVPRDDTYTLFVYVGCVWEIQFNKPG